MASNSKAASNLTSGEQKKGSRDDRMAQLTRKGIRNMNLKEFLELTTDEIDNMTEDEIREAYVQASMHKVRVINHKPPNGAVPYAEQVRDVFGEDEGGCLDLSKPGRGQQRIPSSLTPGDAMDLQQPASTIMTASLPQQNAGILENMALTRLLEKVVQHTADLEENVKTIMTQATKGWKAFEAAALCAQQASSHMEQGIAKLEAAIAQQKACLNEIRVNGSETTDKIHDGIQEMKTAVKAFQDLIEERSADNSVMIGGPPFRTTGRIGALGQHSVALALDESPTEFCHINFQGQRHALLLTHTEEALIRGATTEREVVRRILTKHYTPVELQEMTLKGKGLKGAARPEFPAWLVELAQEAVKKLHGIGEPKPGEDSEITKLREENLKALRQSVRRNISYICQYNRDTRDSDGNMKKRRKRSSKPTNVMPGGGESGEHHGGNEEGSHDENS